MSIIPTISSLAMANVDASSPVSPLSSAISMEDQPTPTPEPESIVSTLRAISESPDLADSALEAELSRAKLSGYTPRDRKDQTVRILQSFIDHLPQCGKRVLVKFVVSNGDDKLHELATDLKTAVLIPFRARGGRTPQVTESPFSDTDITRDDVASEMTESCSRREQQPLKELCLKRDGYRCVVTGIWDDHAEQRCPPGQRGTHIGETELSHIIPFSMGKWEDADEEKAIAQSWETLYVLFPDLYSVLKRSDVNSPQNAMTMLSPLHRNFGNMKIAFLATDRENTYKIKTYRRFSSYLFQQMPPPNQDGDRLITFNQHADYELPSPVLLATHAAITEILHASGQDEQLDELLRDWDAIRCLASDGSTDLQSLLSLGSVDYIRMDKGIGSLSDEAELIPQAMTAVQLGYYSQGKDNEAIMSLADNLAQVVALGAASENVNHHDGNAVRTAKRSTREVSVAPTKKPLHLLDLPMDVLQDIIKEVTHTNDLTSLALTCSALHALVVPQMYSRFDIVWPDTLSSSDHAAGVDALSYGLATLVMGEDLFHETPSAGRSGCQHCGCDARHRQMCNQRETMTLRDTVQAPTHRRTMRHMRRGNYYAQHTRKFSVGNGPLAWVQEYAVTKETGKMLGTLVALAVARMVNLETFIWDMPTGVVRDVWMALSSLANRPGRDCRLERVWVRWHDNTENAMRPASGLLPSASVSPLVRYSHVEYPSLSILPPLKSLSVLDIDEPSYLEEMAVLIDRSRDRLTELRIGISSRVYQCDWLKPRSAASAQEDASDEDPHNWPKARGVLEILSGKWQDYFGHGEISVQPSSIKKSFTGEQVMSHDELIETISDGDGTSSESHSPNHLTGNKVAASTTVQAVSETSDKMPSASCYSTSRTETESDRILRLEILELERVFLCIPVILQAIDWTRVTTLTILRCDGHEKLWRALRRQYAPSAFRNTPNYAKDQDDQASQSEYPLRIKHIHTDSVSPYLLLFIKDAIARNTLETVLLHEAPMYDSIVPIEAIYRNIIRAHRLSLRKILIDSTERSPNGTEVGTRRWRKWMFTRKMISFITSGRMPKLRELSMTINSKDWHYFLQRLPYIPHLRALHIPHIANPVHRSPKELALQILDVVTIRPEVGIGYIGIQSKCYEIVESKRGDKDDDLDDTDDSHSEGFVPGGGPWPASDMNESEDEDGMDSVMESSSELSDYGTSSDDESSSDCTRSRTTFRLREILFYDDKIAIFKSRHGVL